MAPLVQVDLKRFVNEHKSSNYKSVKNGEWYDLTNKQGRVRLFLEWNYLNQQAAE